MKKVLITGENSYIGTSVENWLMKSPEDFEVTTISVKGEEWKDHDFSKYDSIFHVAGIAHADTGNVTESQKKLYYSVNSDLAYSVAKYYQKSRGNKHSQFIYMSSIIVYDDQTYLNKKRIITRDTIPNPSSFYGDSKLQAENKLTLLEKEGFLVAIVRPPMIYGPGSKGNYLTLSRLAKRLPIFPRIKNERSMLFIDNLCEFIKLTINLNISGLLFPQNKSYVATSELVEKIAEINHKRVIITPVFNWIIIILSHIPGKIGKTTNKAFGNLVYDKKISIEKIDDYHQVDFISSIKKTEIY